MDVFDEIRDYWDRHADHDPLWAVLSEASKSSRRWDIARFFQTGASEVASVLYQLESRGLELARGSALDFGCGVGRLTQALAAHFSRVTGVDVSPRMLALANDFNGFPSRVSYVNNQRNDLSVFGAGAFDFIISNIVLQHVAPELALGYIGEFFRLLAPGGALVFQIPSHRRSPHDAPAPSGPRAMPDEAYQATVEVTGAAHLALRTGSSITLDVVITNRSPHAWPASEYGVIRAGNHWRDAGSDRMLNRDDGRSSLASVVGPGESCRVALTITAPADNGDYICEIDLAHEGVLWFSDKGSPTTTFAVRVGPPAQTGNPRRDSPRTPARPERIVDFESIGSRFVGHTESADPGEFPMHGIDRETIVDLITRHGGRLVHIEDDHSCGAEWISFRYYVTRGSA
jgi:SAM-dependent methyltransferase